MMVLAIIIVWCAYLARGALLLVYVSGLLAVGFSPMVRLIERQKLLPIGSKRFPRWFAILLIYVVILGFIAFVLFLVLPPLVSQARALWYALPGWFNEAQQFLIDRGWLHEHITLKQAVERTQVGNSGQAVGTVAVAVANVVGGLFGVVTILILTFYLLVEAEQLRAAFLHLFPANSRVRAAAASREVTFKVSAWLGGQLLLAAIIGSTSAIGLWLIGVPYFYVLALISGVGEMIPVVGPVLSAIPAVTVAFTVSAKTALFVLIFFVVQQQFENHVLVPKIMARQVGVSAVTVIVALLIGAELQGILGAVLAVPTAAVLQVIVSEFVRPDQRP